MTETRESGLEERVRRDAEKAEDNRARQARLGPVVTSETKEAPSEEEPKAEPKPRAKK